MGAYRRFRQLRRRRTSAARQLSAPFGAFDPNERLALIRRTFFATPRSLGQRTIPLTPQSADYPENVRWVDGPVEYVTLDIPGSNNNYPGYDDKDKRPDGDSAESAARNRANLEWLQSAFDDAATHHLQAVMVAQQADMDFADTFKSTGGGPTDGFTDTKAALRRLSIGFPGQVVLVNGDSHSLQIDKPLKDAKGQTIENFTRVQTFGSDQNHWVSATIDPRDPNIFTFHPHVVIANVPTYTTG